MLLTVPTLRYAAPSGAGVLIAPRYRSDFDLGTSQVDPLEAAEPESGLRSVPFWFVRRTFRDPLKKLFLTGSACRALLKDYTLSFDLETSARSASVLLSPRPPL